MSFTVIGIAVLFALGLGAWIFFGGGEEEPAQGESETGTFRCKLCGHVAHKFLDAHNHGVGEHDLQGHHLDESIERG